MKGGDRRRESDVRVRPRQRRRRRRPQPMSAVSVTERQHRDRSCGVCQLSDWRACGAEQSSAAQMRRGLEDDDDDVDGCWLMNGWLFCFLGPCLVSKNFVKIFRFFVTSNL